MDKLETSGDIALLDRPQEIEKPPFLDKSLRGIRAEIIRDILTSGLKSSERLSAELRPYLRSYDPIDFEEDTQSHIDGNVIKPTDDQENLTRQFKDNLYWGSTGSLAVVPERADPDDFLNEGAGVHSRRKYWAPITAQQKEILTQRIRSSFLVVCNRDVAHSLSSSGLITPDNFSYLIFPGGIWRDYLKHDPYANERFSNVLLAEGYVKREVDVKPLEFSVPGYETPIKRILKETRRPIWIHAVRLPTQDDLNVTA